MEELGLPERLFQIGYEPTGQKRINNYFNLRWIEVVKAALSDAQQEQLAESQFRQLMLMGAHTFSVMFAHRMLSCELVTRKLYELWWLFAGKPIRYGIWDFALVTGLNCGTPPTTSLHCQRLGKGGKKGKGRQSKLGQKDKYRDEDTRMRLALLLIVEGILCPTSGSTQLRPEVVEMGRESFLLTVASGKIRAAGQLAQDTLAKQGFAHAMVLVTVCSCPQIIADPRLGKDLVNAEVPIEDVVDGVCSRSVKINIVTVQNLELIGQASVRSILCKGSEIPPFVDEVDDLQVNHMAADAKHSKGLGGLGGGTLDGIFSSPGTADGDGGQPCKTASYAGMGGHGGQLDVPTLVRLVAKEIHARVAPMLGNLNSKFCGEIQSLKDVVLVSHSSRERESEFTGDKDATRGVAAGAATTGMETNTGHEIQQSGSGPSAAIVDNSPFHVLADPNVTFQQAKSGNGETEDVVGEQNKRHEPGGPVDGTPSELLTLATVIDEAVTDVRTDAITSSSSPTGAEADIGGHISAKLSSTIAPPPTVSEQPTQVVGSTDDKMSLTHGGTKASDPSPLLRPPVEPIIGSEHPIPNTSIEASTDMETIVSCERRTDPPILVPVETRASKRRRNPYIKFKPPEPVLKKQKEKKTEYNLGEGVVVDNKVFQSFFESAQPQPTKGITAYDFLPASFLEALRGGYHQFCRVQDVGKFSLSSDFANPGMPNMRWDATVEALYLPFQVDGRNWIGVVIDIPHWCIHVVDCNPVCLNDEKLESLLQPIVNLADAENITEDDLAIAAMTYAVETFSTFNPDHLQEFQDA
ncbi:hypothetical protein Bca52824_087481 [Brassica carinata]|uniref:Ubiquitin-like protease family profile domain-containing protein n=1 Tax=Brassica carinata TaxID=52824 RepID=A0A8X7PCA7_BRACI|nr:hypothetical protein Bca52824_087481 [Brassica carinata]